MAVGVLWAVYGAALPKAGAPTPQAEHLLAVQAFLDRSHFSPGEIDGRGGPNTAKAMAAFVSARHVTVETAMAKEGTPATAPYVIAAEDAAGPFARAIPDDMMAKAQLPTLSYTSTLELLGERFHAAPSLLRRLNPGLRFVAGESLVVPNVAASPDPTAAKPAPAPSPVTVTVTVSRRASALTVTDETGQVLYHAPATTGSAHDPLPLGDWAVTAVVRNPTFSYNPALFWDADPAHARATVAAGPNGPVGTVWIDLTRPHYGIHGTAEPNTIGHTASHGCVRLTNWDAAAVAGLVGKGTKVVFTE